MKVIANLVASDTYTSEIIPITSEDYRIKSVSALNISIRGTWTGTLTLQRMFSDEETWYDIDTFSYNTESRAIISENGVKYRLGFKIGAYTSGTADVRLSC